MPKVKNYTDDDIRKVVRDNISKAGALKDLGLSPKGGNYKTIDTAIKRLELDTSHFKGQGYLKGKSHNWTNGIPLEDIFDGKHPSYTTGGLKRRLLREGFLEEICDDCGLKPIWRDKKLVLILDHINGINNDHRLENLRLLCPNCNSQTDTFAGRNLKNGKPKKERLGGTCKRCSICEKIVSRRNKSGLCLSCSQRKNVGRIDRPTKETLLKEVNEMGYCASGRKYGVSDNAIRKWLK